MSFRDDLRDYFHRLAIRRVLERTLGSGEGEFNASPVVRDPVIVPQGCDIVAAFVANEISRRSIIRREVEALCASIAAPRKRETR